MPHTLPKHEVPIYDLIGVGFGPSNLALAIAVSEHNDGAAPDDGVSALFLEQRPRFEWHRGMLIDDATMQVSFLKDLVTLRNPASEFSFLSYLHSRGRLVEFVNHKNLFPLRVEFHDYFEWAAEKVQDQTAYDHEVLSVEPVTQDGAVRYFDVVTRVPGSDQPVFYRARNVVFGLGLEPSFPEGITPREHIWHSRDLLHKVDDLAAREPARLTVVGAGQSAAETTGFLHRRFPNSEVCAVFSRFGYSPSDDSPFANQVFDPEAVDQFYMAPEEVKQMILNYHGNTNYSVVDLDLIEDLYRRVYQEKVLGVERLRMFNISRLSEVIETERGVRLTVESLSTGEKAVLDSDVLIYSTGYRPADPMPLLGDLRQHCSRDENGRVRVERDYRVVTNSSLQGGIYLQGGTEHTHGITSSLLSNGATRSGEILQSIVDRRSSRVPLSQRYALRDARSA